MNKTNFDQIFTAEKLAQIFPDDRANNFFEALYGDSSEGTYDIRLVFSKSEGNTLIFEFHLTQRPGKCLVCNLTYGLPNVFSRHPVIDTKGMVQQIDQLLNGHGKCINWKIGNTREISQSLHVIPLTIFLE